MFGHGGRWTRMIQRKYEDAFIIERYLQYNSAYPAAKELGVSTQTIYRVLIRHNIPRIKPKPKKTVRISNCSSKYCPALVVMLRTVAGKKYCEITQITGIPGNSVNNIISKRGLQAPKRVTKSDVDLDDIERQYIAGISTYEIAEQYGVCHTTISEWMNERGHYRGKSWRKGTNKGHETQKKNALLMFLKSLEEKTGGKVSYISGYKRTNRGKVKLHCNICGLEFDATPARNCLYKCPSCFAKQREAQYAQQRAETEQRKAQEKAKREQEQQAEYAKEKTCKYCGSVFHSVSKYALYCSKKCQSNANNCEHRHRARKYGVKYEPGITLDKLIKRDRNTCQICGKPCTKRIRDIGHYDPLAPTLDHIQPMVKGGSHTWDNVQLAHSICNSYKRDQTDETQVLEDIHNAQKQAIA